MRAPLLVAGGGSRRRAPEGPLPTVARTEDRATRREAVVERVGLERPAGRQLLERVRDRVLPLVDLACAGDPVRERGRVRAEAAHVELPQVIARLPIDDHLGGGAAGG